MFKFLSDASKTRRVLFGAFSALVGITFSLALYELDHDPEGKLIPVGFALGILSLVLALKIRKSH